MISRRFIGWAVLMTFLVVVVSSGFAYEASSSVLWNWLPTQLDRNLYALRTEIDQTKTEDGAKSP